MADKTYKMQVTLTDNRVLDAGTFVAPQGPAGPQGPQGPVGPQGPKGDPGSGGGSSPILLSQNYGDGSGNIVIRTNGTMYYKKRSNTGALSTPTSSGSVNSLELLTNDEYFIIIYGIGKNISLENMEGVLVNITTTTDTTFVKVSPGIDAEETIINITIISEYYPA